MFISSVVTTAILSVGVIRNCDFKINLDWFRSCSALDTVYWLYNWYLYDSVSYLHVISLVFIRPCDWLFTPPVDVGRSNLSIHAFESVFITQLL